MGTDKKARFDTPNTELDEAPLFTMTTHESLSAFYSFVTVSIKFDTQLLSGKNGLSNELVIFNYVPFGSSFRMFLYPE